MSDTSIQVEPLEPDGAVPVDGLAAHLTGSVGLADQPRDDDLMPDEIAHEVESYQEHAAQRDGHLSDEDQDEDEQQAHNGDKRNVPLGALHSERAKRQQAQAEAEQLRHQLAAHQQQLAQFQQWQAQQQQAQQQTEIPAFVDDPEGHVAALTKQFEQRLNDMQGANLQRQQMEQAAIHVQQTLNDVVPFAQQAEATFSQTHPDYGQASDFVQQSIRNQLAAQNPGASPEQIAATEQLAALQFINHCKASGIDFCQHIYERAQQMGFQTRARTPARRQAPTSLSNLPADGRAPDQRGQLSASNVSNMSVEEFDALWSQMAADARTPGFGI